MPGSMLLVVDRVRLRSVLYTTGPCQLGRGPWCPKPGTLRFWQLRVLPNLGLWLNFFGAADVTVIAGPVLGFAAFMASMKPLSGSVAE